MYSDLLFMESWLPVSSKLIVTEEETHPNHRQEGSDGTEHTYDRDDTRDFLRKTQGTDSRIQCI